MNASLHLRHAIRSVLSSPARRSTLRRLAVGPILLLAFLGATPVMTLAEDDASTIAYPQPGVRFEFPRDHGSHPRFTLEWWYVTGHLFETNGARYGFQSTFFRRTAPGDGAIHSAATPSFGDRRLFLAHVALLDAQTGTFRYQERLNREGWDAAADPLKLDVRNGNWWLRQSDRPPAPSAVGASRVSSQGREVFELYGSIRAEAAFNLELRPLKPLVVFGTNGVSRKAAEPEAASHYLTFPRLDVTGSLTLDGRARPVTGVAWMDHEFSSSQLGKDQVGWDWACLQLKDGREIMTYRMRRSDGSTDPFSTLAWVDVSGRVRHSGPEWFQWEPEGEWRSPKTGAKYPARVRVTTQDPESGKRVVYQLVPLVAGQELTGGVGGLAYWEGACRVLDESGAEVGSAFLEMTGYAASLQGRL